MGPLDEHRDINTLATGRYGSKFEIITFKLMYTE